MTTLPISEFKKIIQEAVRDYPVTIITADTGSGKSTQVSKYLYEAGYKVVVTEPRRMAAWSLAERVAEEMDTELGDIVGFRTGFERKDSKNTSILYCTDGLELVRELSDSRETSCNKVLIIDEVHEWNLNIETLIAWCKKRISEGWETKVVIMSATLEKNDICKFFQNAKLIEVPGKLFPVEVHHESKEELIPCILQMIDEGRNTLVFVPGKKEISEVCEELSGEEAVVLPLHGELDSIQQRKCFKEYSKPKVVVATNVAQTSITIPDIDAVVDTGEERRIEAYSGIEGLYLRNISQADCLQRKGRAGRTKEGKYILCSDTSLENRPEFSVPEMQRCILDQVVLRLAVCGIDATELEFFHQPSIDALVRAKNSLVLLGALTAENAVTDIGYKMAKMPVSVKSARMIVEAEKYGVTKDVICIASILEMGSLLGKDTSYRSFTDENESDLLAELDVWNKLQPMQYIDFKELGINKKTYYRVKEHLAKMHDVLKNLVEISSTGDKDSIRKSCIAGMLEHVYTSTNRDWYSNGDDIERKLNRSSCINRFSYWSLPKIVVGEARAIEYKDKRFNCSRTLDLICMATKVTIEDLKEVAPEFVSEKEIDPYYSSYEDSVVVTKIVYYRDQIISTNYYIAVPDHPDYTRLKEEYMSKKMEVFSTPSKQPERQKYVYIDGKAFEVHYLSYCGDKAYIFVDDDTLYTTDVKNVYLDNGKLVELYTGYSAYGSTGFTNMSVLRNHVENQRLNSAWKMKASLLPELKSSSLDDILAVLPKLGKYEITLSNGGYGDCKPIYGYACILLKDNSLSLKLIDDEETANQNTQESIKFVYGQTITSKYPERKFKFSRAKFLSSKELKVKNSFYSEVLYLSDRVTAQNLEESLSYLDELYQDMIKDLNKL